MAFESLACRLLSSIVCLQCYFFFGNFIFDPPATIGRDFRADPCGFRPLGTLAASAGCVIARSIRSRSKHCSTDGPIGLGIYIPPCDVINDRELVATTCALSQVRKAPNSPQRRCYCEPSPTRLTYCSSSSFRRKRGLLFHR